MLCISAVCFGKTGKWDLPEGIDAFCLSLNVCLIRASYIKETVRNMSALLVLVVRITSSSIAIQATG